MSNPHVILVPGFWLGAWAWREVADALSAAGHSVEALTLPGLESVSANRAEVTFGDHVDAICAAIEASRSPVVLVLHSGAGATGYAATDRLPQRLSAVVYVDTGPATSPIIPDFPGAELPMPAQEELAANESLEGLTEEHLRVFRERAVPEPGLVAGGSAELANDARLNIPSVVICTSVPSEVIKASVETGEPWVGDLGRLRNLSYVDLPTSHWPMWSRPQELAGLVAEIAAAHAASA